MNYTKVYNPLTKDIHNETMEIDENNYISYLIPHANVLLSSFASDNPDVGETALCTRDPWKCLILNGDFREEYASLVNQGYDACLSFYNSHSEARSSWSD